MPLDSEHTHTHINKVRRLYAIYMYSYVSAMSEMMIYSAPHWVAFKNAFAFAFAFLCLWLATAKRCLLLTCPYLLFFSVSLSVWLSLSASRSLSAHCCMYSIFKLHENISRSTKQEFNIFSIWFAWHYETSKTQRQWEFGLCSEADVLDDIKHI